MYGSLEIEIFLVYLKYYRSLSSCFEKVCPLAVSAI